MPGEPSFLRRLLGMAGIGSLGESYGESWPELQKQWTNMEMEFPNETQRVPRVMEAGPVFKYLNPEAYAVTGPFGNIALNRELIEKEKQDLGSVLAHELGHVEQGKKGYLRQFYDRDKLEREAINKEAFRNRRERDIPLRGTKIDPNIKVPTRSLGLRGR